MPEVSHILATITKIILLPLWTLKIKIVVLNGIKASFLPLIVLVCLAFVCFMSFSHNLVKTLFSVIDEGVKRTTREPAIMVNYPFVLFARFTCSSFCHEKNKTWKYCTIYWMAIRIDTFLKYLNSYKSCYFHLAVLWSILIVRIKSNVAFCTIHE